VLTPMVLSITEAGNIPVVLGGITTRVSFKNMMIRAVVDTNVIVGVDDDPVAGTYLLQNYPNPVKGSTQIQYGIQNHNGPVEINIYNILGQKVDSIQGEEGVATWNPGELPSGIYFYKLETANFTQTR